MRPPVQAPTYRIILVGLVLCSIIFMPSVSMAAHRQHHHQPSGNRSQLQHKRATIQSRISQVRQKLHVVKMKERQKTVQLHGVEARLRVARGQLHIATLRLTRAQIELRNSSHALNQAQQQFASARDEVSQRLVALYDRGDQGYSDLLLTADDFGTLLQRAQLAKLMKEQDREALQDLKVHQDKVTEYHQHIRQQTAQVAAWQQQVAVIHERVNMERSHVASELTATRQTETETADQLAALERDSNAITSMLQQMQQTPAGQRRFHRVYAGPIGGLPVAGRITSPFGWRYHPILHTSRMHTGVDIAAPTGTPIFAVGGGEVIWAGWRGGYGNAVMIDHGGGKVTLYGHMSRVMVHAGQIIARRQIVGLVGMTGMATGPHCHFEVRINGRPVNPL